MKRFTLGLAPVLAVSALAVNSIAIGISIALTLVISASFNKIIGNRLPKIILNILSVIIISAAVTSLQIAAGYFTPDLSSSLGIYLPIIAVNCLIYDMSGIYPENEAPRSVILVFFSLAVASVLIGLIREVAGKGTITMMISGAGFVYDLAKSGSKGLALAPAMVFVLPAGGFIIIGLALALIQYITNKTQTGKTPQEV